MNEQFPKKPERPAEVPLFVWLVTAAMLFISVAAVIEQAKPIICK